MLARRWLACFAALLAHGCLIELNPDFVGGDDGVSGSDTSSDPGSAGTGDVPCPDDCLFEGVYHECVEGVCVAEIAFGIIADTYATEQSPSESHGSEDRLRVSSGQGMGERAFIQLPLLTALPPDLAAIRVTLRIDSETGPAMLDLHRITEPWSADTLTWMSMPAAEPVFVTMPVQMGSNEIDLQPYLDAIEGQPSYGISLRTMSPNEIVIRSSDDPMGMSPQVRYELEW